MAKLRSAIHRTAKQAAVFCCLLVFGFACAILLILVVYG